MSFFQNNFQVKQKELGLLYFMLFLSILYQTTKNDKICIRYRRGHSTAAFCRDREMNLSEEPKPRVASSDAVWFWNAESFNRTRDKIRSKPNSLKEEWLWIIWMVKGNVVCAVLVLYLLIQSLKPKELRSQGQHPPKIEYLCKMLPFFEAIPTVAYSATEEKQECSDRPQWKAFNPIQGILWCFGGTEFISQGTSQHHDSCLEPVHPSEDFSAQRAAESHCHSMGTAHTSKNKSSLGLEVSSPDFTSQAIGLTSGCQLHSLCWQPVFFC